MKIEYFHILNDIRVNWLQMTENRPASGLLFFVTPFYNQLSVSRLNCRFVGTGDFFAHRKKNTDKGPLLLIWFRNSKDP